MSAIDDLTNDMVKFYDGRTHYGRKARAALCDLLSLRERFSKRGEELDSAHKYLDESPVNDCEGDASLSLADRIAPIVNEVITLRAELAELKASRAELMARLAAYGDVESPDAETVLTPRKCVAGRACYRKGWEAAQEAAAQAASGEWRLRQYDGNYQYMNLDCVADVVRALEPPDDCGGACNPLEPDADAVSVIDAAMSRGYTEKSETPLDGYGREVLEAIKNDIQQRMK